ncbi:hypothetical protein BUALT_Bualt12G0007700 [Buddleja alternifolia]|uniref:HTH myb-type domain-containing protein n=1 Tax=Buddleja alternifolia TaxID=168488 RepID=A0AAV6WNX3_9LAMI|nr:hypothetical protein BUALT_Bualt12G0007700 [Buddleja alternifolia]
MKGIQHNYGFSSDLIPEFPDYFPQNYANQQHQSQEIGLCNPQSGHVTENHKFWPDNSSSTIIGRIGSPATAFYATELYMGLSNYDSSQQFKNSYPGSIENPDMQSSFGVTKAPQPNSPYFRHEGPSSYRTPFSNLSEREKLLHIKTKLLGDLDDSNRRSPSAPFDSNNDLGVSQNLYSSHFGHINHFGRPPGCPSTPSSNNPAVSSSKTRIRWTQDLHDRFVECVNRLDGPDKATPKAILKLMDTEGLTIFHVKSHLQKYRNAKCPESIEAKSEKKITSTNNAAEIDIKNGMELKEALQLQLDVQRRLHEQLEIQRNLQMRIEEQSKQLKIMFDQQQKTTQSLIETKNSSSISTTVEDAEVLVLDGSDDECFFHPR